jgi:hypothetical protein
LDNDLISLIQKLRNNGYGCYLATNQNPYRWDFLINEMGLRNTKDQNGFWEQTINELRRTYTGIALNEILFVDDLQNNIAAANRLDY